MAIIYETNYTVRKGKTGNPFSIKGVIVTINDQDHEQDFYFLKRDDFYLKRALKLIDIPNKEAHNYTVEKIEIVKEIGEANTI